MHYPLLHAHLRELEKRGMGNGDERGLTDSL